MHLCFFFQMKLRPCFGGGLDEKNKNKNERCLGAGWARARRQPSDISPTLEKCLSMQEWRLPATVSGWIASSTDFLFRFFSFDHSPRPAPCWPFVSSNARNRFVWFFCVFFFIPPIFSWTLYSIILLDSYNFFTSSPFSPRNGHFSNVMSLPRSRWQVHQKIKKKKGMWPSLLSFLLLFDSNSCYWSLSNLFLFCFFFNMPMRIERNK